MWQAVVVGLIVMVASMYAAWVLLPAAARLRLTQGLAAFVQRAQGPEWLIRMTAAIERGARRRLGGCGDCGAVQAAPGSSRSRGKP